MTGLPEHPDPGGLDARVVARLGDLALDVALAVQPGEVLALVGPNGSGKSTAVRALAGLVPLRGGHVRVGGSVLDGDGVHLAPAARGVGTVFQDHLLVPHLSALENAAFGLRARGVPSGVARAEARRWLDLLGLADHEGLRASRLSGGQSQRVALARALAARPRLLLLDEPFSALDATARSGVRELLDAHVRAHPVPVVLVSHDAADLDRLAGRTVHLDRGRAVPRPGDPTGTTDPAGAPSPEPPTVPRVGVVVLAGGTARRIGGGDKTALAVGGARILDRLLDAVAPAETVVVADDPGRAARDRHPHARWVREQPTGGGPAAALDAGARALPEVDVVVALAGDQPYAGAVVPRLLAALADHPRAAAALASGEDGRPQHLLAAYRAPTLRDALRGVRPGDSLRAVRAVGTAVLVPASPAETLDVDTPDDLATARRLHGA